MSIRNKNNNRTIDYFTIIYTLRTFDSELEDITSLSNCEKFFSKVMSYLYTIPSLADYFKKQFEVFLDSDKDTEYSILYKKSYDKIKHITQSIASNSNTTINYYANGRVNFNSTFRFKGLCDIPMIYMYPSIGLFQYINPEEKNVSTFEISESLSVMYKNFNEHYQNLEIVDNVEFFIVWLISYQSLRKIFDKVYIRENIIKYLLTSMRYVLLKMLKFVSDKIEQIYTAKHSIRLLYAINNEQTLYTLVYKQKEDRFYIDSSPLNLTPKLLQNLKFILKIEFKAIEKLTSTYIKQDVSRINKTSKEIIEQNLLENKQGQYILKPNIELIEK